MCRIIPIAAEAFRVFYIHWKQTLPFLFRQILLWWCSVTMLQWAFGTDIHLLFYLLHNTRLRKVMQLYGSSALLVSIQVTRCEEKKLRCTARTVQHQFSPAVGCHLRSKVLSCTVYTVISIHFLCWRWLEIVQCDLKINTGSQFASCSSSARVVKKV